jgi:DNA-binding transcriptional LysR family regulator
VLLRQLEYLVALAREGHFGRAAESCWVSQPTLSAGVRKLEADLGVAIVRRGHRFEGLTPEGERLLAWAQQVLAERDDLFIELGARRSGGLSGRLRIGAIPTSLPPISLITAPFCATYPGVDLSVVSQPASAIVRRLRNFEIDVGLMYLGGDELDSMLTIALYEERYLLLTPSTGPFGGRTSVSWSEVAATPLCLLSPEMENRQILDRIFLEEGTQVSPQIETNSMSILASHVATGRWSSIVSQSWLSAFGTPIDTALIPLEPPQPMRSIGIVAAHRHTHPALTGAFISIAESVNLRATLSSYASPDR